MKPSWSDAPEWANWLAMDENNKWFWFKGEPVIMMKWGYWNTDEEFEYAGINDSGWQDSLEQRPKEESECPQMKH